MSKKNKKPSGNTHNKIASIALILIGSLFSILGIMQPFMNTEIRIFIIIGVILVVLGGILFKKSFLNK